MKTLKLSILFLFIATLFVNDLQAQRLNFQGLNAQGEGAIAYPANGHGIPGVPAVAYTNIASADEAPGNHIANARAAAHFTGIESQFANLEAALQNRDINQLRFSFTPMNLGNDQRGVDWDMAGSIETRHYRSGRVKVKWNGTQIASGNVPSFDITIDWGVLAQNGDENFTGVTDWINLTFADNLNGDAAAIATALQRDLGANCRVKFVYESMGIGVQRPTHGIYEAQAGHMIASCNVNQNVNANTTSTNNNNVSNITTIGNKGKCRVTGIVANNANMKQKFTFTTVTYTNTTNNKKYTVKTDKSGRYNIYVPKGTYAVSCNVKGFKPYVKKISVNCINKANPKLPYETMNILMRK